MDEGTAGEGLVFTKFQGTGVKGLGAGVSMVLVGVGLAVEMDHEEMGAESLVEDLFGENLGRGAEGNQGAVEAGHVGSAARDAGEVVGTEDDGGAFLLEFKDYVKEAVLGRGVEAGHGFVHQEEVRFVSQGAGQEDPAALPAGEFADEALAVLVHADPFQGKGGSLPVFVGDAVEEAPPGIASHEGDVGDGDREVPFDVFGLGHIADAFTLQGIFQTLDPHPALPGFNQPHDAFHQGGLAGTVGADDADDFLLRNLKGEVFQGGHVSVTDAEVLHFQGWGEVQVLGGRNWRGVMVAVEGMVHCDVKVEPPLEIRF